jgi:hypothetical protein
VAHVPYCIHIANAVNTLPISLAPPPPTTIISALETSLT